MNFNEIWITFHSEPVSYIEIKGELIPNDNSLLQNDLEDFPLLRCISGKLLSGHISCSLGPTDPSGLGLNIA